MFSWWRTDVEGPIQFPSHVWLLSRNVWKAKFNWDGLAETYKWHFWHDSLSVIRLITWWFRAPRGTCFLKWGKGACALRSWFRNWYRVTPPLRGGDKDLISHWEECQRIHGSFKSTIEWLNVSSVAASQIICELTIEFNNMTIIFL